MINKVLLSGNLGKDAEVFSSDNGNVVRLTLATSENKKNKKTNEWESVPTWHTVICFGKSAERVKEYKKGWLIWVEGKIQYRTHEDKQYTDIVCDYSKVLNRKESTKEEPKKEEIPEWERR